ncbi:hypothetical protein ACSLVP_27640, partial [Klebsiella pneumoniae]|uniref:hypothetical protein n=1 Tax=Klebsiella pneumoniae TaxID=573 RepID=UPI003EDF1EC7
VKPANVIDASGVYKLIDFGIASAATRPERHESRSVVIDDLPFELVGTQVSQLPSEFLAGSDASGDFPAGTL